MRVILRGSERGYPALSISSYFFFFFLVNSQQSLIDLTSKQIAIMEVSNCFRAIYNCYSIMMLHQKSKILAYQCED